MRNQFCAAMIDQGRNPETVFLTGDLGFMALEPLQATLGTRFINAGVAEQNMVSVAAALAKEGFAAWTYSIAPFMYARPFEQIRNDVCLHHLPVRLVGNGGGYGYGVMGPTHHALGDYGALLTFPGMSAVVPVFDEDVAGAVAAAAAMQGPCYLRLGRGELPAGATAPAYAPWRKLLAGDHGIALAVGPIAGSAWSVFAALPAAARPELWTATELPLAPSAEFLAAVGAKRRLLVIEEHVAQGGAASELCPLLMRRGIAVTAFRHLCAQGYVSGRYGSQTWHRRESGLDPEAIRQAALELAAA